MAFEQCAPEMREGLDKALSDFLKHVPVQKRLGGLTLDERLQGLAAEEMLRQYRPEDVLRALDYETRERLEKLAQR